MALSQPKTLAVPAVAGLGLYGLHFLLHVLWPASVVHDIPLILGGLFAASVSMPRRSLFKRRVKQTDRRLGKR
jgi:hypothetical protein